jgi:hypothetical protein
MNQDHLNQTARQLQQPTPAAAAEFAARRDALAEALNQRMSARPDLDHLIGPGNLLMMQTNSRNFCRFMNTMFHGYEPGVLVETVLWVFRAYRTHGFHTTYWAANLDTFLDVIRAELTPATCQQVAPFFQWLVVNIPLFVKITDGQLAAPVTASPDHGVQR